MLALGMSLAGATTALVFACGNDGAREAPPAPVDDAADAAPAVREDAGPVQPTTDAGADADAGPVFVHRDVNHVLGTGQSLSVGSVGTPPLSLTQPYDNITFETGVMSGDAGLGLTSFIPLVEGDTNNGVAVETMSSAFANHVTMTARTTLFPGVGHDLLVSAAGVGGRAYSFLKKGTYPFVASMDQVRAGRDLAAAAGKSYVVRAVTCVHGESDHVDGSLTYEADVLAWQSDYETEVRALTGQTDPVPMFHTQFSSWTKLAGSKTTSDVVLAQLAAHVDAPGKVILVGPKYHLPYAGDGVHLTNEGYRHMGEDYAKAYRRVVLEGGVWEPVRPKNVARNGAVLTVDFHVPAPPLVLDAGRVVDPGAAGFEYTDDSASPPAIATVAVTGPTTVTITLAAAPTGGNRRLRYAFTGTPGAKGGATSGPRGCLRDSDKTPSRHGYELFNWAVHFDAPVP